MDDAASQAGAGTGVEATPGQLPAKREKLAARDIKIGSAGINFTNAGEVMAFANMMAESGSAVPPMFRGHPGACLAVIDDGIRFGMSPYALARGAYEVNGILAYESRIIAAVIIARAPIKDRPTYEFTGEGDKLRCTVTVETLTGRIIKHVSPPIGEIKPQNSPLWKSDREQQLGYYTVRAMGRRNFPDVLGGVYDLEEAAMARAVDVTPAPQAVEEPAGSIMSRLPGPGATTVSETVENGKNGHHEDGVGKAPEKTSAKSATAASEAPAEVEAGEDEVPPLIADITEALAAATSRDEVSAAYSEFEGAVEAASVEHQELARQTLEARLAEFPAPKKRTKTGQAALKL